MTLFLRSERLPLTACVCVRVRAPVSARTSVFIIQSSTLWFSVTLHTPGVGLKGSEPWLEGDENTHRSWLLDSLADTFKESQIN